MSKELKGRKAHFSWCWIELAELRIQKLSVIQKSHQQPIISTSYHLTIKSHYFNTQLQFSQSYWTLSLFWMKKISNQSATIEYVKHTCPLLKKVLLWILQWRWCYLIERSDNIKNWKLSICHFLCIAVAVASAFMGAYLQKYIYFYTRWYNNSLDVIAHKSIQSHDGFVRCNDGFGILWEIMELFEFSKTVKFLNIFLSLNFWIFFDRYKEFWTELTSRFSKLMKNSLYASIIKKKKSFKFKLNNSITSCIKMSHTIPLLTYIL